MVRIESIAASRIALVISSILLSVGMLGLRAGYGNRIGGFGRAMLLLGVLGMALVFVCIGALYRLQPEIQIGNARIETWFPFYFGPVIGLLGLAALIYLQAASIVFDPLVSGFVLLALSIAAAVAVGWRRAPMLGALWSILLLAAFGPLCSTI